MEYLSTKFKLSLSVNEIHLSLTHGEPAALVSLDLSAAFNTINHTTLLDCLKSWLGVCSTALQWFTSKQLKLGQPSLNCRSCYLEFHLPIRILGYSVHPAVVAKNLNCCLVSC